MLCGETGFCRLVLSVWGVGWFLFGIVCLLGGCLGVVGLFQLLLRHLVANVFLVEVG